MPLLGGVVVLMLIFVMLKSCTGEGGDAVVMESVPTAPAPDADTPADTIKTLTANVAAMTSAVEALRRDNQRLAANGRAAIRYTTVRSASLPAACTRLCWKVAVSQRPRSVLGSRICG